MGRYFNLINSIISDGFINTGTGTYSEADWSFFSLRL